MPSPTTVADARSCRTGRKVTCGRARCRRHFALSRVSVTQPPLRFDRIRSPTARSRRPSEWGSSDVGDDGPLCLIPIIGLLPASGPRGPRHRARRCRRCHRAQTDLRRPIYAGEIEHPGNFPQAFTPVALIGAVSTLNASEREAESDFLSMTRVNAMAQEWSQRQIGQSAHTIASWSERPNARTSARPSVWAFGRSEVRATGEAFPCEVQPRGGMR